ncbi:MAG: DUF1501 domain-containing protein, partial [Candidatus Omnitrophica bacterium]|nr:DUF1501 domain-containing protein [Candidatus Omnitrophota bacterium]
MTVHPKVKEIITRRHFFQECGLGVGKIALASLLGGGFKHLGAQAAIENPLAPKAPHFAPTAKRVIYLFMAGGPSQLDLFDRKPTLEKYDGQPIPAEVVKDQRYAFIERNASLMASPFKFSKYGDSGAELSEMLPHLGEIADDVCILKSVHTDAFNHAPAQVFMNTGSQQLGRPSMGSWVTYGLGSEAEDLPAFVVLNSAGGLSGGANNYGCGFLPTVYQGVLLRSQGDPILNLSNPPGYTREMQGEAIDLINSLNQDHLGLVGDPEIKTRINSYEMAYRLQESAPDLIDIKQESEETLEMYGVEPGKASFANNCLLARRLAERGVRFINLYHEAWDHHSNVKGGLEQQCKLTDQAAAALVKDLKQRGLLEDTLVVWGGEFGRT